MSALPRLFVGLVLLTAFSTSNVATLSMLLWVLLLLSSEKKPCRQPAHRQGSPRENSFFPPKGVYLLNPGHGQKFRFDEKILRARDHAERGASRHVTLRRSQQGFHPVF